VWKLSAQTKNTLTLVLIGLGSNIQPEKNLPAALEQLSKHTAVIKISSVWQTKAVGSSGPDYLNAAVLIGTELTQAELREQVLTRIEAQLGRVRSADKYMDRTIDLDVLVFNGKQVDPELWTQAHVAVPAAQLLPEFTNKDTGETLLSSSLRLADQANLEERQDLI
jgi:2-amino-4-hydroxy-6-hydroxymethyldihydropteridine diphosphokinase